MRQPQNVHSWYEESGSGLGHATPARSRCAFLEVFRSSYFADVSLNQWMALTPPELIEAHLKLGPEVMEALRKSKVPIVPG
jgi:oxalate decarboxylase/phosphoglucose isomerase-like protein (cupin superfamily)